MEWKKLLSSETQGTREEPKDFEKYPISDLEKDYKAIVSSSAFRRLQDKTQVFPLDKSDFVRTRLTHSMEVSTIARQLGIMVTQEKSRFLKEVFKKNIDGINEKIPSVLSCAGLLHDLGNPPFGHFGEVVIGQWFQKAFADNSFKYNNKPVREILTDQMRNDLCNFEGNAQALRILSKISNKKESHEINLTKGVISALIKYPMDSLSFKGKDDEDIRKHKLGYYYAEKDSFYKIAEETGTLLEKDDVARHPLAYLMEAADDIAYSTADLEDAYKKRLFTLKEFIDFFENGIKEEGKEIKEDKEQKINKMNLLIQELKDKLSKEESSSEKCTEEADMIVFQNWMDSVRQWFMYCAAFSFSKNYKAIMDGTYNKELIEETFHGPSMKILKKAMVRYVYGNPEIVKLELSAQKILSALLNDFAYAVINFDDPKKQSPAEKKLCGLMVTDFISGMTDSYAKNLYQELNGI